MTVQKTPTFTSDDEWDFVFEDTASTSLQTMDQSRSALVDVPVEPVGEVGELPGSNGGFTMAVFKASDVPLGTKIYASPPIPHKEGEDSAEVVDAARDVIASASDTYKKRNGHLGSFEDDSGEKCWIVPFDAFEKLRSALATSERGWANEARYRIGYGFCSAENLAYRYEIYQLAIRATKPWHQVRICVVGVPLGPKSTG